MIIFESIEIIIFDGNADTTITESRLTMSVDNYELLGRPSFTTTSKKARGKKGFLHFMVFDTSLPPAASVSLSEQRHFDQAGEAFTLFHDRKEDEEEQYACFVFDRMVTPDSPLAQQQPLTKPQRRLSYPKVEPSTQALCSKLENLLEPPIICSQEEHEAPTMKRAAL
jgi:hypothetical protein